MASEKDDFEDLAIEVNLDRRERSYSFGEPRVGGGFLAANAAIANPGAGFSAASNKLAAVVFSSGDKAAIRAVLDAFEKIPLNQVATTHGQYTLDPYTVVQDGTLAVIGQAEAQDLTNSATSGAFAAAAASPANIVEINISFTDERTASVQYSIEQDGHHALCAAILVRTGADWKIAVYCQHPLTP